MPRVAIIGAGPAGSAAAMVLARARADIMIFESRPFPRMKVCGEFISPSVVPTLQRLLSADELRAAGARAIPTLTLELGDDEITWPMPLAGWAISRATLDDMLLNKARAAGATVVDSSTVHRVEYTADRVMLHLADGADYTADVVIHADGSGRLDPAGPVPVDSAFLAAKCHFQSAGPGPGGVRIRAAAGAYIGTIAVENGLGTCALVARCDLVRAHRGDFNAMLDALWPARRWADRPDWLACPVPRSRYIQPGHPRSFRIGNAAAAVDPIGGEGIATALWAGAALGDLLSAVDPARLDDLRAVQSPFARAYRRRLLTRMPACRIAAWSVIRPRVVRAIWPALRRPALALRPWYRLTGKPA